MTEHRPTWSYVDGLHDEFVHTLGEQRRWWEERVRFARRRGMWLGATVTHVVWSICTFSFGG